ncbi:MAG: ABC transporter ATP-binding protein [Bifidobacteriaceae bacterium]|jgi:ABC-2 type transport system ATP-binding protein|nr:ABC transporter ATP-binding protein [Bifidobacteriaceae bacterium]
MNEMLEVRGLAKRYGEPALRDVSFALPPGYIMGLVGPNGAGKTTTINAILGFIHPDSGTVKLFGDGARGDLTRVGVVMDAPLFLDEWRVGQVGRVLAPSYPRWDQAAFLGHLERFGLDGARRVKALSRGMKVKLQLALALSQGADLLILDEPTSGLDPLVREDVCDLLLGFVGDERKSVLLSTHITQDLERIADFITLIDGGRTTYSGTKDELLERYRRVAGGPDGIGHEGVIGAREHPTGFEGLIEAGAAPALPAGVICEPATLEQIVVGLVRAGREKEAAR